MFLDHITVLGLPLYFVAFDFIIFCVAGWIYAVSYTHLDVYKRQVRVLEQTGFRGSVMECMKACADKSRNM